MSTPKKYYTYIATNDRNTVLYTGMTNNISKRVWIHQMKVSRDSFTAKYNVCKLVWYQEFETPQEAIEIEKKIKGWKRVKKIALIERVNHDWKNLLV